MSAWEIDRAVASGGQYCVSHAEADIAAVVAEYWSWLVSADLLLSNQSGISCECSYLDICVFALQLSTKYLTTCVQPLTTLEHEAGKGLASEERRYQCW